MKGNNYKEIAAEAAREAGKLLIKHFTKLDKGKIQLKSKHEIVTPADLEAESLILKKLKKNFPDYKILSEEAGENDKSSDYLWVVDPMDGTTNFSMGNPLFSVSIGLFKKNKLIVGVVYVPFLDNLYVAQKGKGAFLNGNKIKVSTEKKIKNAFLTFCHGNDEESIRRAVNIYRKLKLEARDIRQVGSAAIECAWVAQGKTEAIIIPGVNVWDVAAGVLLIREAGGVVNDMYGVEWDLNSEGIIATNKVINDELVRVVKNL